MLVVSDTSPLLNLAIIGRLSLIRDQFNQVVVPLSVFEELKANENLPGSAYLKMAIDEGWILQRSVIQEPSLQLLLRDLHRGEAEAIALGLQAKADWVLMDEREGRKYAKALGLRVTGVLGILLRAKYEKKIPSLKQAIDELSNLAGFRISSHLIERLLTECHEMLDAP